MTNDGIYHCLSLIVHISVSIKPLQSILECDPDRWGEECQSKCLCVPGHTKYCSADSGHCECELGWSGSTCETDEDECLTQNTCDLETEICENMNGSFRCVCKPALGRQENGECLGTYTVAEDIASLIV